MGTIHAHEFVTLDGYFDDPSFTFPFGFDPAMGETLGAITGAASDILLGRTTYEMFAPAWRDRTPDDDPGAPFFNDTTKHVVGANPLVEQWNNTVALGAYDPAAIADLKATAQGDIYISGSGQLVRGLLHDGLLDSLHLFVYPVVLGRGERLFTDQEMTLTLQESQSYDNGVLHLAYGPAAT
ncbi:dihydrofolate reductase family protein [Tsukamurella strandjordii]|uniref:Dihydrofolate reductase family protein n=1 Tax=Tsukamurella strandjordii TaxID=147577 RepID=A0AA90NDQ5_9ACTN|nr:dihydrofolate reductase family protein [Tsukamurella strandjordii]MDP0398517.1 dihydrofolate reductase family protein [Tsukamurella strandjordii]